MMCMSWITKLVCAGAIVAGILLSGFALPTEAHQQGNSSEASEFPFVGIPDSVRAAVDDRIIDLMDEGVVLKGLGHYDAAEQKFLEAYNWSLRLEDRDWRGFTVAWSASSLGDLHLELEEYEEAVEWLEKAVQAYDWIEEDVHLRLYAPGDYASLAEAYKGLGREGKSLEALERGKVVADGLLPYMEPLDAVNPDFSSDRGFHLFTLAEFYRRYAESFQPVDVAAIDVYSKALRFYDALVQLLEREVEDWLWLGAIDATEALDLFRAVAAEMAKNLAVNHHKIKNYEQAIDAYQQFLSLSQVRDLNGTVLWMMANCHSQLGRITEAIACLDEAADIFQEEGLDEDLEEALEGLKLSRCVLAYEHRDESGALRIATSCVTSGVGDDNCPVDERRSFSSLDEKAVCWVAFDGTPRDETIRFVFVVPNGFVYHEGVAQAQWQLHWYWIWISGEAAATKPGTWTVKIYIDDRLEAEMHFEIRLVLGKE